jgi:hypothetical protein
VAGAGTPLLIQLAFCPGHAGRPEDSGISLEIIEKLGPSIPTFGVCMGHQCIGQVFGGKVVRAPCGVMHGKTSLVWHTNVGLMEVSMTERLGLPERQGGGLAGAALLAEGGQARGLLCAGCAGGAALGLPQDVAVHGGLLHSQVVRCMRRTGMS